MTTILLWLTTGLAVSLAGIYTLQSYMAAMRRISRRYGRSVVYVLFFAMAGLTYWAGGKGDDPDRGMPLSLAIPRQISS